MFSNYIKIAWRNLRRYKGYSAINIIGITTGLVCCLLILLLILHELSYDRFHVHADRIYRVLTDETGERGTEYLASTNTPLAPLLAAEFPEMTKIVRIVPYAVSVKIDDNRLFQEDEFVFADSTLFDIFTFDFLRGDARTALAEPFSVVLTEAAAMKYFGSA
ncbi:MAG TPA: ABC transporter permease, partial [Bacteroidota bacterium]